MSITIPKTTKISEEEKTPLVLMLLEIIHSLKEENQQLKDEIARLKGQKPRPKIKPSQLEKPAKKNKKSGKKRAGSEKRKKIKEIVIHREEVCKPGQTLPEGSHFKGYHDFVVQDIKIEAFNTKYRIERWETPDGKYLIDKLPAELNDSHFGPTLKSFILYQYYHSHVTQPLLLEQLDEWGIDISSGMLNDILISNKEDYHKEKDQILAAGLDVFSYINVNDTGARHKGKNGYCTHIGYVKKRKISGSTRSSDGRRCRDTFTILKKTCRKLGVSFWKYIKDRVKGKGTISDLPDLLRTTAINSAS